MIVIIDMQAIKKKKKKKKTPNKHTTKTRKAEEQSTHVNQTKRLFCGHIPSHCFTAVNAAWSLALTSGGLSSGHNA
jgi:hypothetical protein